ncbi:MAG: esterase family protein, partial [Cellvibrionales bacterium]|nr:esterase family protein [Cellvibrionales bacterium]
DPPQVTAGQLRHFPQFPSQHVPPRDIRVWLPTSYAELRQQGHKLPVLYLQDGQMLFDARTTWNGQEWGIDEVAAKLIAAGQVPPFIAVGIDNGGPTRRNAEYFPQKPFVALPATLQAASHPPQSAAYLRFLTEELMPFIEREFAIQRDSAWLMGSSMGALISLYALTEYPHLFAGAACLSTHWPASLAPPQESQTLAAILAYLTAHLPPAGHHRLYFDHGDQDLDANYAPYQKQVDQLLQTKGYTAADSLSLVFPGQTHDEQAWQDRLHIPLTFLLGANHDS